MNRFEQIIQREFAKAMSCDPSAVHVDMSEDEVIRVTYDCDVYVCDCSDDETFYFLCDGDNALVTFPIPADYLEN